METTAATTSSGGETLGGTVSNSLTSLIPTFDPSLDSVEVWAQKVELLSKVWPSDKITELITRLILNCKGSAFQKLQIRQQELLKNDLKCVKQLVELVGGQFGQVPLEKKYEAAERALFRSLQKTDESNDSYLARTDVAWAELLSQQPQMKLEELQAYIVLRGSQLGSDDKKRVLIEAGAETGGVLTMQRVTSAIRLLGAGFFQDYTGLKKTKLKTYDQTAFVAEEEVEPDHETYYAQEEDHEEDFLDQLAQDGDEDAILVAEYEAAMSDTVQDDRELATALTAYQDARRRLSERFRNRGFWPVRPSKGKGKGKAFGKGKGGRSRKSLQDRILSSRCRLCNKVGHWKAECPERNSASSINSGASASASMVSGASTMYASESNRENEDILGLEFLSLPQVLEEPSLDEPKLHESCFGVLSVNQALKGISERVRGKNTSKSFVHRSFPRNDEPRVDSVSESINSVDLLFVSHGCSGVVDLGASKTVIGSEHLSELIQSLDRTTQSQLQRCPCQMHFRFGNQGVLSSSQALIVPIGKAKVKIAIVPGKTPFLISNALLRGLQAVIDTHNHCLKSPFLHHPVKLSLTPRGLFLMDLNELIVAARKPSGNRSDHAICSTETLEEPGKEELESRPIQESMVKVSSGDLESSKVDASTEVNRNSMSQSNRKSDHEEFRCRINNEHQQPEAKAQSDLSCSSIDRDTTHVNVVARSSSCKGAGQGGDTIARHRQVRFDRTGRDEDSVRKDTCWQDVQSHVGARTAVDHLVCATLPKLRETGTSTGESLCGVEGRSGRDMEPESTGDGINQGCHGQSTEPQDHDDSQSQGQVADSRTKDGEGRSGCLHTGGNVTMGSSDGGGRLAVGRSSTERGRTIPSGLLGSRCVEPSESFAEHGKHAATGCESYSDHSQREIQSEVEPLESWEALIVAGDIDCHDRLNRETQPSDMSRRFQKVLKVINQELEDIARQSPKEHRKSTDLFEVFCGSQSRLTQQVQQLQGTAVRFSKDRTDLMTTEGRQVLFTELCKCKPRHLWFSPECGPWSAWSNLNQMKSMDLWDKIHNARVANLEQLAIGVVLLRFQRSQGNHFHWEQPGRSYMFRTPLLQELYQKTIAAEFDMCNLGELIDPSTGKLIKKAMIVMTTSETLQQSLHGHHCRKNHDHQAIEGTTKYEGRTISRSAYTENYPRKFVRYVSRILLRKQIHTERPIGWELQEAFVTANSDRAPKRRRLSCVPAVRSTSQKTSRDNPDEDVQQPKRFCLWGKVSKEPDQEEKNQIWKQILEDVAPTLPRVGRTEITDAQIVSRIQSMIGSQHEIKTIVGGKGLNRTTAPLRKFAIGEAPWRKLVYIHRNTGKIHGIDHWEKWEDLSNRKIVRTGFPSSVAITIFTGNPISGSASEQLNDSSRAGSFESSLLGPAQSQQQPESVEKLPEPSDHVNSNQTEDVDVQHDQHGPMFNRLTREDQSLLMKIHKNAGHPGPDKLAYLLKQQGYPPEFVAAVSDLQCSACQAMSKPKISRPSAIHSPCDFNDIISMDGYSWKSQQGTNYHFYHIVDHSTSFQVAKYAPNRSVEHAIESIVQSWFAWAGSPNEMVVDAATELNAENFSQFMQQCNVKCTTISTDAHWQNGKAERHGEILAQMLSKYDLEHPIKNATDLQIALAHCTQAKNSLSIRKGYAPEVLVLGKQTRLPGSVCSDNQLPAHALADAEHCHGLLFRQQLARRETARRAYHMADNDASLRRAILRRSRPARQWYQPREWVMVWKSGLNAGWRGPMKVVIHESSQTVWVTQNGKLFRHAPEHIRPVTAIESREIPRHEVFQPLPQVGETMLENPRNPEESVPVEQIPSTEPTANQITNHPEQESHPPSEVEPSSEPNPGEQSSGHSEVGIGQPSVEAADIPVPEDIHDELVGWHCSDEDNIENISFQKAWVGEIVIQDQDIERWKTEDQPTEMAFLVSAAKRQKSEVRLRDLDPKEVELFKKAKQGEINNWLSTGTVKRIFRNQIPEDQILRCRWLLTWKNVEQPAHGEPDQKAKARLIVLGYLDPQLEDLPRDSPTMNKTSRMLVLQMISSEGWDLMSFDVKAAFLQGTQSGRTLGLEPVPELSEAMKLKPGEVCQLVKGAYGLVDAPYLWYKTLQAELVRLGFRTTPFDPCTFVLYDQTNTKPQGIIGIHVDDGLCGGNGKFLEKLQQLEAKYPFGAKKMGEIHIYRY